MIKRYLSWQVVLTGGLLLANGFAWGAPNRRFLNKADIVLYGLSLRVDPPQQTVPKGIATIVSTYLQAPGTSTATIAVPPFAADAQVVGTLYGPSFPSPITLTTTPNTPFQIPPLPVAGTHILDDIHLVLGGQTVMAATPNNVSINVIDHLLVTQVSATAMTLDQIKAAGIIFDASSFQAYNFTVAFAVAVGGGAITINFPVVMPVVQNSTGTATVPTVTLPGLTQPILPKLATLIPDILKLQTQIPNLSVTGFTLDIPPDKGGGLVVPPIPGVIVVPGNIGFLDQFFDVKLIVGNAAPSGSNLVVNNLNATIVLPVGPDGVLATPDDPLVMAPTVTGPSPRVAPVLQPGNVATIAPGEIGAADFLVEGKHEGSAMLQIAMAGTLEGLPGGPVAITGKALGSVLVRNPTFTLTFMHPDVVQAGEAYTLDVTVTNTSSSTVNLVSLNLSPSDISGASLQDAPGRQLNSLKPNDSATVSYHFVSKLSGAIFAATLDAGDHVSGQFSFKTGIGSLGIPLSPDTVVLPSQADSVPPGLRRAALDLLGQAWSVATAPGGSLPASVLPFTKVVVIERAIQIAEAGFHIQLQEKPRDSAAQLALDFLGSDMGRLSLLYLNADDLAREQTDMAHFDSLRRQSFRGVALARAIADELAPDLATMGAAPFHYDIAQKWAYRPAHLSILASATGGPLPVNVTVIDPNGNYLGGLDSDGQTVKQIPFADQWTIQAASGSVNAQMDVLAYPATGAYQIQIDPVSGASAAAPYTLSLVIPDGSGGLRQFVYSNVTAATALQAPALAGGPFQVSWQVSASTGAGVAPTGNNPVLEPLAAPVGAVQQRTADALACPITNNHYVEVGRVLALLFNIEVDTMDVHNLDHYGVDSNQVLDVALQPDRRTVFMALRDPIGPLVARSIGVDGLLDAKGRVMTSSAAVSIQTTVPFTAATVSGRILQADGTSVPDAPVSLTYILDCKEEGGIKHITVSQKVADSSGTYSWDYVSQADPATVTATDPIHDATRTVGISIARAGQRLNYDIVFLGRGTIQGTTRDQNGNPLSGTALRLTSLTDQSEYGATSDSAGHYVITGLPVGNVFIEAVNADANAQTTASSYIPSAGATVMQDLTLQSLTQPNVSIQYGSVSGHVLRHDGVTPAAGLPVYVYYKPDSQPGVGCSGGKSAISEFGDCAVALAQTDAAGAFEFPRVPAGRLRIYSLDQAAYQEVSGSVVLAASGTVHVTLYLTGGFGTVTGTVLDGGGNPVPNAQIYGGVSLATSLADGSFVLPDVPVGSRQITAVSAALGVKGSATANLAKDGDTTHIVITLPVVGTIAGIVTAPDGLTPVPNQIVYLFFPGETAIMVLSSVTTNGQGYYSFPNLTYGDYRVSAFNASFTAGNVITAHVRYQGQVAAGNIQFRGGGGTVTGTVYISSGAARTPLIGEVGVTGDQVTVVGGLVGIAFKSVSNFAATTSNSSGTYKLRGVWVGNFVVNAATVFAPTPISKAGVMPSPGATVTVDVDMNAQASGKIRGTLYQPDGVTPVGANVPLHFKSAAFANVCTTDSMTGEENCTPVAQGIQDESAVTDTTGAFYFPLVNPGGFSIAAQDSTGHRGSVGGSVQPGQTAQMSFRLLGRADVNVKVTGFDGFTPIANARVTAAQANTTDKLFIADSSGTVSFSGGDAYNEGTVFITAVDPLTGFIGRASGTIVKDGQALSLAVHLYNAFGAVTGKVLHPDRLTPAPFAEVEVVRGGDVGQTGDLAYIVADASGAFQFSGIPLGAFQLNSFDAANARQGSAAGTIDFNGETVTVNLIENAVGVVTGSALDAGSLEPLAGWQATITAGRLFGILHATTGDDGRFAFPGVPQGPFVVTVYSDSMAGSAGAAGTLQREGQVVDVPLLVQQPQKLTGTVEGVILDPAGTSSNGAQITICSGLVCTPITADPSGLFSLPGVPLGRVQVSAKNPLTGATGSILGDLLIANDVLHVTVLLAGTASVSGTVVSSSGVPVANVNVTLAGQPSAGCPGGACTVATDASGHFAFTNVPARTFTLSAVDPISNLKGSVGDVLNPGDAKVVTIVLQPTAVLQGRVLTQGGVPAQVIGLVLQDQVGTGSQTTLYGQTLPDGTFAYPAVPVGLYALTLQDPIGPGLAKRSGNLVSDTNLGDIVLSESPPQVAATSPDASAVGVLPEATVTIRFAAPIDPGSVSTTTLFVSASSGPAVLASLTVTNNNQTVILTPVRPLAQATQFTLTVRDLVDTLGRSMTAPFTSVFTTIDLTPPAWVSITPSTGATNVPDNSVVRLQASKPLDTALFDPAAFKVSTASGPVAGSVNFAFGNTTLIFTPTIPFSDNTLYSVSVATVTDLSGNSQASPLSYTFRTATSQAPQVTLSANRVGQVIENTTVIVTAATDIPAAYVNFYINNVLMNSANTAPFTFAFAAVPSLGAPGTTLKITALAAGFNGQTGAVPATLSLVVTADQPPAVSIAAPASGDAFNTGALVTVQVQAADDVGLTRITFRADTGNPADTATRTLNPAKTADAETFGFRIPTNVPGGVPITVEAAAQDTAGRIVQASAIAVQVIDTTPPTVTVNGLISGQRVNPGAAVTLVVQAADPAGLRTIGANVTGALTMASSQSIAGLTSAVATFNFTVPSSAQVGQALTLDPYATNSVGLTGHGNSILLPIANTVPPSIQIAPQNGSRLVDPGATAVIVATASDTLAVATINLAGTGAWSYSDGRTISPPAPSATAYFNVPVPDTAQPGQTLALVGTAANTSNLTGASAALTLTVSTNVPVSVILPASIVLDVPVSSAVPVLLSPAAPAAGLVVNFITSDPKISTVTPSLSFAPGQSSGTILVTAKGLGVGYVTAFANSVQRAQMTVTVRGGIVQGTVSRVDASSNVIPVPNAQVTAESKGVFASTTTNSQGFYSVGGLPGPDASVQVLDPVTQLRGYNSGTMNYPGGQVTIDVMLLSAARIHGQALMADTTTSLGLGAQVTLTEVGSGSSIAQVFTAADGSYDFPLVNPGTFILDALAPDGNHGRTTAQTVTSGQDLNLPIICLGRGTVTGKVLNGLGTPVPNAVVTFQSTSEFGLGPTLQVTSAPDGSYTFGPIFVGNFSIQAVDPITRLGGLVSGTVASDKQVVVQNVALAPYGTVQGTVFQADGVTPAPGASVETGDPQKTDYQQTTADPNGFFIFPVMPLGNFTLLAKRPSVHGIGQSTGTIAQAGDSPTVNINFLPQGSIFVTVQDSNTVPVAGAAVTLTVNNYLMTDQVSGATDATGAVLLQQVLFGSFTVTASSGAASGQVQDQLNAPVQKSETITLKWPPPVIPGHGAIQGHVYKPDGVTPANDGTVHLNWGTP